MRQTGPLMMNSMKRFVKQRESNQPPQPAFRDDAASGAIYSVARHPDVLDRLGAQLWSQRTLAELDRVADVAVRRRRRTASTS